MLQTDVGNYEYSESPANQLQRHLKFLHRNHVTKEHDFKDTAPLLSTNVFLFFDLLWCKPVWSCRGRSGRPARTRGVQRPAELTSWTPRRWGGSDRGSTNIPPSRPCLPRWLEKVSPMHSSFSIIRYFLPNPASIDKKSKIKKYLFADWTTSGSSL